jgi:hypothetical protein
MGRNFNAYDLAFRDHCEATYGTSRMPYNWYEPAYRYGHEMATADRYRGREWEMARAELQAEWEERGEEGAWEDVEEAVRHAWIR